jgi:Inner membrane component of T3SS, cytoplasmic domain
VPVQLEILEGAEAGAQLPVTGSIVLGRADDADLTLADAGVSRTHARVSAGAEGATIEDLGSSNGTFVNGERVEGARPLSDGDQIQLGGAILQVSEGTAETEMIDPDATAPYAGPGADEPAVATPPVIPAPVPEEPAPEKPFIPAPAPPEPAQAKAPPPPPRREPIAQPQPAAPAERDFANDYNLPALGAIVLGPLSILLIIFSSGSGFYAALPIAIAGIALGTIGRNKVDRGESARFRGLASAGRTFGIVGTIVAAIILIAVIIINQALDVSAENLGELIDEIRDEIESR